jgi:hypothetical protein
VIALALISILQILAGRSHLDVPLVAPSILLAQHVHRASPRPLYVEPITLAPQPPPAVTENEVTRIPAIRPAPVVLERPSMVDRALDLLPDWWPFAFLASVIAAVAFASRDRKKRRVDLPDRYSKAKKRTSARMELSTVVSEHYRDLYEDHVYENQTLPVPPRKYAPRRTAECTTQYIDTIRAQVRRMIGRDDIRCEFDPEAPREMQWRAWIGPQDFQSTSPERRATGAREGGALRRLLAAHRYHGGDWVGFAVDRERTSLVEVVGVAISTPIAIVEEPADAAVEQSVAA